VIADLNPLLRGWGNYFRTGNAAIKFRQADDYVVWRLRSLMKIIDKPYAGKPHVRIERGMGKRAWSGTAPLTTNGR
jgi:Group II intron, maturase-specific domain